MFDQRAEAIENVSTDLSEEHLRLFGQEAALGVFYTFLDYIPCFDEGDRVESRIARPAGLDAWIAAVEICLTERQSRQGH